MCWCASTATAGVSHTPPPSRTHDQMGDRSMRLPGVTEASGLGDLSGLLLLAPGTAAGHKLLEGDATWRGRGQSVNGSWDEESLTPPPPQPPLRQQESRGGSSRLFVWLMMQIERERTAEGRSCPSPLTPLIQNSSITQLFCWVFIPVGGLDHYFAASNVVFIP